MDRRAALSQEVLIIEKANVQDGSKCPVCDVYLRPGEGFICTVCRRGPLCHTHKEPGRKMCTSCGFDLRSRELSEMRKQEEGLRSFLRLAQFVFLLCAIFFISKKMELFETVEFLQELPITDYVIYSMGAVSVGCYLFFYLVLLAQKNKIRDTESVLNSIKYRRLVQ